MLKSIQIGIYSLKRMIPCRIKMPLKNMPIRRRTAYQILYTRREWDAERGIFPTTTRCMT